MDTTSEHIGNGLCRIGLLAFLAVALCTLPALAQNKYKLSETDSWDMTTNLDPASPEGQLAQARISLAAGEAERAQNLASSWIERFPGHALLPDAYMIRGDALLAQNEEYDALFDYEFVARVYPGSDAFVAANQREFEIGKAYAHGKHRKLFGLRIADASDEAQELLIRVQERLPGSTLAEQAGMELADFYFDRRQMSLAADAYELFIENYPRSSQIEKARRRLIYTHLAQFKGPEYDPTSLYEARTGLMDLQLQNPALAQQVGAEALLVRINESDAEKLLTNVQWYLRRNDYVAADFLLRRILRRYPTSATAIRAAEVGQQILPHLPERLRKTAPDYAALALHPASPGSSAPATHESTPQTTSSSASDYQPAAAQP
ncbi:MAG TPA: outer membrane protein assembly factor BamD [Phycisphaerales bacterium]|nr:outer membrane protein assembly factor BamD [Phycisphaerales bacterium]